MYHDTIRAAPEMLAGTQLIEAFEDGRFPDGPFPHVEHVRLAHAYLAEVGLLETLRRYPSGLRSLATRHGTPDRYHETVTWGLIVLIHERMAVAGEPGDWARFAAANPDLLRWEDGAFFTRYPRSILGSALARRTFVLPG